MLKKELKKVKYNRNLTKSPIIQLQVVLQNTMNMILLKVRLLKVGMLNVRGV